VFSATAYDQGHRPNQTEQTPHPPSLHLNTITYLTIFIIYVRTFLITPLYLHQKESPSASKIRSWYLPGEPSPVSALTANSESGAYKSHSPSARTSLSQKEVPHSRCGKPGPLVLAAMLTPIHILRAVLETDTGSRCRGSRSRRATTAAAPVGDRSLSFR
jgi:hypothetical protein